MSRPCPAAKRKDIKTLEIYDTGLNNTKVTLLLVGESLLLGWSEKMLYAKTPFPILSTNKCSKEKHQPKTGYSVECSCAMVAHGSFNDWRTCMHSLRGAVSALQASSITCQGLHRHNTLVECPSCLFLASKLLLVAGLNTCIVHWPTDLHTLFRSKSSL